MDLSISDLRVRAVTLIVAAVALLSFITGILNIGATTITGPLSQYIPLQIQQAAGFTGALTGFLMLATVLGLRRRLEAAWKSAMILLPATAIQGLIQSNILSLPLVILSIIGLPSLILHRSDFTEEVSLNPVQLASLAALIGTQIYGTAGTLALSEGFSRNLTPLDAVYYSIVTSSTVGYGEIVPVTPEARLFTITLVILGPAVFAAALGTLIAPLIESKLSKRFETIEDEIIEEIHEQTE